MGLDIYLYTAEQARRNAEYEAASEAFYEPGPDGTSPRDRMSEDERKAWYAEHEYSRYDRVPSERYPDHLFKRRYLRSSYNGGGFNHAVPEMLASSDGLYPEDYGSLYWIFEPMEREWDGDEGALTADDIDKLRASKARALEVAEGLRKADRLRVMTIDHNPFGGLSTRTDADALKSYRAEVAKGSGPFGDGWYSTDGGNLNMFGDGLTVLAALPGRSSLNTPAVHLIYRAGDEGFESYIQSAEIVAEFCDEAIGLIERDGSCRLSWSG